MRDIKIIQLLNTFSEEEYIDFINFANSAYFRKGRKYTDILSGLKEYLSETKDIKNIPNEKFYDKIFRGKKFNNQTLRNRLNELTKIGEKFIIEKELNNEDNISRLLLLKGYNKRKLKKQFLIEYKKINNIVESTTPKTNTISDTLYQKVLFSKESGNFEEMFSDFNKYIEYVMAYFLERFFDVTKEYEIEKNYGVNPTTKILDFFISNLNTEKLIKALEEQNNNFHMILILNYYKYKSLANLNDITWFNKLQKLFFVKMNYLDDHTKNDILNDMISYYFEKINSGKTEFLVEVFKLYKLKLSLGLLDELEEIRYPSSAFRDYIVVGIRLKQYKWVEMFIKKYSDELPPEIKEEETYMAYARLYFGKREFDKSLEMTNNIQTDNPLYFLDASRFKLRIFYETVNFEESFLEMDRIKHYIKNNTKKIALPIRKYSKEFLDSYNQLLKFRLSPNKKELDFFMKKIKESVTLVTKNWFVEKIKEL